MHHRIFYIITFAIFFSSCTAQNFSFSPAQNEAVKVFILAGQSNAVGYNDIREYQNGKVDFPKTLRKQPKTAFWDSEIENWLCYRIKKHSFGPETGFSHRLKEAGLSQQIAIIKYAVGGTGIARSKDYTDFIPALPHFDDKGNNWYPPINCENPGILYANLSHQIYKALELLDSQNVEWELAGFIWMQGEHEGGVSPSMAKDYATLLPQFIKSIRKQLNAPSLPVLIGEINSHSWKYRSIVHQTQIEFCQSDKNAVLIKTADLSRNGSGGASHFDADSMIILGNRFAEGYLQNFNQ